MQLALLCPSVDGLGRTYMYSTVDTLGQVLTGVQMFFHCQLPLQLHSMATGLLRLQTSLDLLSACLACSLLDKRLLGELEVVREEHIPFSSSPASSSKALLSQAEDQPKFLFLADFINFLSCCLSLSLFGERHVSYTL